MSAELTNLLPEDRKKSLRRQYFIRLVSLLFILLSILVALNAIMLIPTYLYARDEMERSSAELTQLRASAQDAGEAEVATRTKALEGAAAGLLRLETVTTASAAMRAVLAVPRPNVSLTCFTFTAPTAAAPQARMQVNGVAGSRDALRQYVQALDALPFVERVDLPLSAYAQETDIEFTITLTGTLRP